MMNEAFMTTDEAIAMLEADKTRRAGLVQAAIQAVLTEHSCGLVAVPQIVDGRIVAIIQIVAS